MFFLLYTINNLQRKSIYPTSEMHPQTGCNDPTDLRGQRVVHEDVWTRGVWSKRPDGPGSQQIPVILCLEKLPQLLPVVRKQNQAG